MRIGLIQAFVILLGLIELALGLTCLHCTGITNPRQCRRVTKCGDFERCSLERVTNEFGEDVYDLGCRSSQTCRNVTSSGSCSSCCSADLCNSEGCGQMGYPDPRGPICYSCHTATPAGRCHDIDHCEPGEVCLIKGRVDFGDEVYTTMCTSHHACGDSSPDASPIGRKRHVVRSHEVHTCDTCCTGDLCNHNCSVTWSSVTPVFTPKPTSPRPISGMTGTDCYDIKQRYNTAVTGVYTITTATTGTIMSVLCDMDTDGGGWTVFQHRFDGSVDFYRNYSDYENGFGDPSGEFWMGLRYIKEMVDAGTSELRYDLETFDNTTAYEVYSDFSLGPNSTLYTLSLGSSTDSANMMETDSLIYNDDHAFLTYDQTGASDSSTCPSKYHGAFWYSNCFYVNPNGRYEQGNNEASMSMTDWDDYKSARTWKMMFRRI